MVLTEDDAPPSPTADAVDDPSQEVPPSSQTQQTKKPPISMTYEAYKQMTNMILLRMKQQEQIAELGTSVVSPLLPPL